MKTKNISKILIGLSIISRLNYLSAQENNGFTIRSEALKTIMNLSLAEETSPDEDLFPYAQRGDTLEPFSRWGFELGISNYSPDFSNFNSAFTTIEDSFRQQGYDISHCSPMRVSSLFMVNLRINWSPTLSSAIETGTNFPKKGKLNVFSLSQSYRFPYLWKTKIQPFLGLALSHYYFYKKSNYGDAFIGYDGTYYYYLESIIGRGSQTGLTFTGGIEYTMTSIVGLNLFVGYLLIPAAKTHTVKYYMGDLGTATLQNIDAEVKLSGIITGARLIFYI